MPEIFTYSTTFFIWQYKINQLLFVFDILKSLEEYSVVVGDDDDVVDDGRESIIF